jgi:HSP20 family protein
LPSPSEHPAESINNLKKGDTTVAEVNVTRQPKQERAPVSRWPGFDTPLFRGSIFSMNPFAVMKQFAEDMDRYWGQTPRAAGDGAAWSPAIEVKEKEGKLVVTAELPGLKKEDVNVHIDGDTLVVEGERKQEKEEKREGYYHSERSYGKFYRSILLPEGAKIDQTAAQFNNGVLEVSVPIPEAKAARKEIPVQEGQKPKAA